MGNKQSILSRIPPEGVTRIRYEVSYEGGRQNGDWWIGTMTTTYPDALQDRISSETFEQRAGELFALANRTLPSRKLGWILFIIYWIGMCITLLSIAFSPSVSAWILWGIGVALLAGSMVQLSFHIRMHNKFAKEVRQKFESYNSSDRENSVHWNLFTYNESNSRKQVYTMCNPMNKAYVIEIDIAPRTSELNNE